MCVHMWKEGTHTHRHAWMCRPRPRGSYMRRRGEGQKAASLEEFQLPLCCASRLETIGPAAVFFYCNPFLCKVDSPPMLSLVKTVLTCAEVAIQVGNNSPDTANFLSRHPTSNVKKSKRATRDFARRVFGLFVYLSIYLPFTSRRRQSASV